MLSCCENLEAASTCYLAVKLLNHKHVLSCTNLEAPSACHLAVKLWNHEHVLSCCTNLEAPSTCYLRSNFETLSTCCHAVKIWKPCASAILLLNFGNPEHLLSWLRIIRGRRRWRGAWYTTPPPQNMWRMAQLLFWGEWLPIEHIHFYILKTVLLRLTGRRRRLGFFCFRKLIID